MKNVLIAGACLAISAMLPSCRQTDYNANISTPTYSSMDDVFAKLSLKSKVLTVDAATGGSFYGNSGTRYVFTANSLQTANGASVTGNVRVEVCEYLNKGDMIFSKMLPISNDQLLVSGGELSITASQNGQPVYLKQGYVLQANIPTKGTPPPEMLLFTGQSTSDTSITKVNWTLRRDTVKHIGVYTKTGMDTLFMVTDSLKHINCDRFYGQADLQNFSLTLSSSGAPIPSSAPIRAYIVFSDIKSIMPFYPNGKELNAINIPKKPVHLVAFTLINGKFYAGSLDVTPSTGSNYTITLSQKDIDEFKKQLNNM